MRGARFPGSDQRASFQDNNTGREIFQQVADGKPVKGMVRRSFLSSWPSTKAIGRPGPLGDFASGLLESTHLTGLCKAQSLVCPHASEAFLPEKNQTCCHSLRIPRGDWFSGGWACGDQGRVASVSWGEYWVASVRNIGRLRLPIFGRGPRLGTVALPFCGPLTVACHSRRKRYQRGRVTLIGFHPVPLSLSVFSLAQKSSLPTLGTNHFRSVSSLGVLKISLQ